MHRPFHVETTGGARTLGTRVRRTLTALLLPALMTAAVREARAQSVPRCVRTLAASKAARGITRATWALLDTMALDQRVLAQLDAQPEFTLPVWDYVAIMVDSERVADGRRLLRDDRTMFDSIATQSGVDANVLVAIWGIESNFGRGQGGLSVLRSLATLSCAGRRQLYFRGELIAALRIVQAGDIAPARFRGSWAGAFGQTQFMPSTFWNRAVDFDGDGKRDLIDNAGDAVASAANYLRHGGWHPGTPWGFEVRVPTGMADSMLTAPREGRTVRRTLAEWTRRGFTRVDGRPLVGVDASAEQLAGLYVPSTRAGPAFLVLPNFDAVFHYNASSSYTLSVLHLADRIAGAGAFVTPWPTDDPGLSRRDRHELQTLLVAHGHAIATRDGTLNAETRTAVKDEQTKRGWPATGRPGQRLLTALRATP